MNLILMGTRAGNARLRKVKYTIGVYVQCCCCSHAFISRYSFASCINMLFYVSWIPQSPSNIPVFLSNKSSDYQKPLMEGSHMF